MEIMIVPLSLRRINHHHVGNYPDYLDELIGRKLNAARRKYAGARRYKLAV